MNIQTALVAALFGYLLGSISFSLLLARLKGIDLREVGSGNLGATNASRALGKWGGILVYFLDAAKGFLPAWAVLAYTAQEKGGLGQLEPAVLAGLAAYAGHIWPVYFGFRGGKGVATLTGLVLAFHPMTLAWAAVALLVTVIPTKWMSLGSLAIGMTLPISAWYYELPEPVFYGFLVAGLFLFWTHRSNIGRILSGTERRIGDKKS